VFGTIEQYVRISAIVLLTVVFSGGIMVAIAFLVFGQQRDRMEEERQKLLSQVKTAVAKESLLIMIRGRVGAIDKIFDSQVSYAPFVDTTMNVIQTIPLSSLSMGEKNSVAISVNVVTLEEAMNVLTTLMDMEQKKKITNPVLQSFSMNEGKIQIGLSYTVVL